MRARVLAAALALASAGVVVRTQSVTFSSRVDVVRVDVLVTDNGQPVRGLGAADFEIRDNGVVQQIELVSFDQVPLNVVLALDMSASVAGDRLERLRTAGGVLLGGLQKNDQAALVTFSQAVTLGARLSGDVAPVRTALARATGAGSTSLIDGAYTALQVGETDAGRALLVIFSDGLDTSSWLPAGAVLDAARRSDGVAYAVAVRSAAKIDRALPSMVRRGWPGVTSAPEWTCRRHWSEESIVVKVRAAILIPAAVPRALAMTCARISSVLGVTAREVASQEAASSLSARRIKGRMAWGVR